MAKLDISKLTPEEQDAERRFASAMLAYKNGQGPFPNPFDYTTPNGRPSGVIPQREPEVSYEDFWASVPIE